jgi:hypothetical protein
MIDGTLLIFVYLYHKGMLNLIVKPKRSTPGAGQIMVVIRVYPELIPFTSHPLNQLSLCLS